MSETGSVLVLRRVIPVPRDQAFAAWLDPASLAEWMRPKDVAKATVEVDARVGGKFRIVMIHGRGGEEHWGEYLAIDPPSRLSFTWMSANTDLRPCCHRRVSRERKQYGTDPDAHWSSAGEGRRAQERLDRHHR